MDFDPNSFVFVTYNGAAEVYGLDASAHWQLSDAWSLHGALGLLDSDIKDSEASRAVSPGAIKRDLAHAPAWTLNLGAGFQSEGGWFGRLDVNAVDSFYFDISHNQRSDSRGNEFPPSRNPTRSALLSQWTNSAMAGTKSSRSSSAEMTSE